jgi:sulfur carrier protein
MRIMVNGAEREIEDNATISEVLAALALTGKRVAVEVNAEIVTRSLHAQTRLQPGDRVEIVHAIGGG